MTVIDVTMPVFHNVPPAPERNMLPVPKASVLAVDPEEEKNPHVTESEFMLSVPLAIFRVVADPIVRASCSVHTPATPLKVTFPEMVVPPVVMFAVVVERNVTPAVVVHTVPEIRDRLPYTLRAGLVPFTKETVPAETEKSRQLILPVIVTLYVPA